MIVQSPEQREKSRRILLPWLVRLRCWRTKRQAKRFSERQARILKAHAKKSAKIEKARLRLVGKEPPQSSLHTDYDPKALVKGPMIVERSPKFWRGG